MRSPVHAKFGLAESTEMSIKYSVNLYLSSFPGEEVSFHTQNARKCIEEALDSLNIRLESKKVILKNNRREPR